MNWQETEQEISAIPGNAPVLDKLCGLLEEGESIALVGAGASAGLWPLWDEFLAGFIEHSKNAGEITKEQADHFIKKAPKDPLVTAQQLRNKIRNGDDEGFYFEYIQKTFSDCPQTDCAFTPTHKALLQLPIKNYVTLNYDAGLTNARTYLYPKATSSYYFWDQEEAKNILEAGYKRLVLHAHGRHDRADSIILTLDDYRRAYDRPGFVRLLNTLFAHKNLLMVGFGLSDPYIKQLFNNISKDYKKSPNRHIAFVGLDDDGTQVTDLLREEVQMIYGADVIFYPTKDDHKALSLWLSALADKYSETTAEEAKPLAVSAVTESLADNYVHEPTDDENFKGRVEDFEKLNRWGNDPDTRIMAVTGIGGQGKTALSGRWLKRERVGELDKLPVFYWSFYENIDVGKFLEGVVKFLLPIVRVAPEEIEPISFILSVVQQARILLVLDGLEVLQEEANQAHGQIKDPQLQQLLSLWAQHKHQSLMLITSRFSFPQLSRYAGVSFHQLSLLRLSKEDGISLLERLGILGDDELKADYVDKLYGHPLALRVLASTVKRCCYSDLSQYEGDNILTPPTLTLPPEGGGRGGGDDLTRKLAHMLEFYQEQLQHGQQELMGILSLFKRPVELKSFVPLLKGMESLKDTPLAGADDATIKAQLKFLTDDFLVEETSEGLTCHPVIRDYFRKGHKLSGSRREVADFLSKQPGGERPKNIDEVRYLVNAVQLLCEAGDFKAANDLRKARLSEGGYGFNVFKNLPAPVEGLECFMAFVGDEERQKTVETALSKSALANYISGVGLYHMYLGNLPQSKGWWHKEFLLQNKQGQAGVLQDVSSIEQAMGNIYEAHKTVSQALALSKETRNLSDLRTEFAYKAYYDFLLGNVVEAYQGFYVALLYEQKRKSDEKSLSSLSGNQQAEFFVRLKARNQFEQVNAWNIKNCKEYDWNPYLAMCYFLQGWYEIEQGNLSQAEAALRQADHILRNAKMPQELCRLDWAWGLLAEAKDDYTEGLRRVNDSLTTCADKGFRLWQITAYAI